ncbi:hypothetical protein N0V90_007544 [Kalmusia sp. IMI 367209]|nr:hypothetical protein N0V90_007544 [Kalmusia sp. IMI 367209]
MGEASVQVDNSVSNLKVKGIDFSEVYSENVVAKIVQVAQRGLKQQFPRTGPAQGVMSIGKPTSGHVDSFQDASIRSLNGLSDTLESSTSLRIHLPN